MSNKIYKIERIINWTKVGRFNKNLNDLTLTLIGNFTLSGTGAADHLLASAYTHKDRALAIGLVQAHNLRDGFDIAVTEDGKIKTVYSLRESFFNADVKLSNLSSDGLHYFFIHTSMNTINFLEIRTPDTNELTSLRIEHTGIGQQANINISEVPSVDPLITSLQNLQPQTIRVIGSPQPTSLASANYYDVPMVFNGLIDPLTGLPLYEVDLDQKVLVGPVE